MVFEYYEYRDAVNVEYDPEMPAGITEVIETCAAVDAADGDCQNLFRLLEQPYKLEVGAYSGRGMFYRAKGDVPVWVVERLERSGFIRFLNHPSFRE